MASPDFLGWNGVQEADIARWYDRPFQRDLPGQLQWMDTHDEPLSPSAYQKALELIRTRVDCARKWQVTLGRALVDNACLGRKTEKQWLALGSARQREMMEVTLDTICRRKDIRRIRFDVPEIRMAELLERGGQGFVDLAERCVAPSGSRQEVHWVENKRYDQLVGTPAVCQREHWNVGQHKTECGGQLLSRYTSTFADPTPKKATVRRTLDLEAQIAMIAQGKMFYAVIWRDGHYTGYSVGPEQEDFARKTKFYELRRRAFENPADRNVVAEFYIRLRMFVMRGGDVCDLSEDGTVRGPLKRQFAREFSLDVDELVVEYFKKMDGPLSPEFGFPTDRFEPPPISSALQRQLDALEINPLAFYQVFGKDDLPAGRSINLEYSEDPVPTPDILRRFAIRYRYPKLIATILIAVRLHISDTELPMFEAQLLEEFEITLADLRQGELDCAAPSQFPTTLR